MTDLANLEQLTADLESLRSDLPARAFTGLGRLVQLDLNERGPVSPERLEQLRTEANADAADVEALTAMAETDADGRITGAMGLTVNPTVHQLHVDGHQVYTWCAFDSLVFPIAHGWTAEVRSVCPATGRTITATVTPQGVTGLQPAEAVLAVAIPTSGRSPATADQVKAAFCSRSNLYASAQSAREATADDPDATLVAVGDAHRFGQRLVEALDAGSPAASSQPYTCTLSDEEAPARTQQVRELAAGLLKRHRSGGEIRLAFEAALEPVVHAFVRDESRCCAFYDLEVHHRGDIVELTVRAPADAEAMLSALDEAVTTAAGVDAT